MKGRFAFTRLSASGATGSKPLSWSRPSGISPTCKGGNFMVMEIAKWAASCFLLACGAPLQEHHSSELFDLSTQTWLKGRVTSNEAINPHALITLEVADDKGDVRQWTIEGPRLGRIARLGIDGDFV